jgi:DNA repair photolyase
VHEAGVSTWVFIAPVLPIIPARLIKAVKPHSNHLLVDSLNYRNQVRDIFLKNHWDYELSDQYAAVTRSTLMELWGKPGRGREEFH